MSQSTDKPVKPAPPKAMSAGVKLRDLAAQNNVSPAQLIQAVGSKIEGLTATSMLSESQVTIAVQALRPEPENNSVAHATNSEGLFSDVPLVTDDEWSAQQSAEVVRKLTQLACTRVQTAQRQVDIEDLLDGLIEAYVASGAIKTNDPTLGLLIVRLGEDRKIALRLNPVSLVSEDGEGGLSLPPAALQSMLAGVKRTPPMNVEAKVVQPVKQVALSAGN